MSQFTGFSFKDGVLLIKVEKGNTIKLENSADDDAFYNKCCISLTNEERVYLFDGVECTLVSVDKLQEIIELARTVNLDESNSK